MRKEVIGDAVLYCGDCLEVMADMVNDCFELAIVDPPYGIGESGKNNKSRGKLATAKDYKPFHGDDLKAPSPEYFDNIQRVSENQIIWGANHFIDNFSFMCNSSCWVVWDKINGQTDFADCELAWTSLKTAVRQFRFQWQGMLQQNMKNKEVRIHPTQKPVALYKWLLKNYAKEGDHILDTHGGSFSSVIACLDMGFKITAYEIDEDYFEAGCERVRQHLRQGKLFTPPKQQPKPQGLF